MADYFKTTQKENKISKPATIALIVVIIIFIIVIYYLYCKSIDQIENAVIMQTRIKVETEWRTKINKEREKFAKQIQYYDQKLMVAEQTYSKKNTEAANYRKLMNERNKEIMLLEQTTEQKLQTCTNTINEILDKWQISDAEKEAAHYEIIKISNLKIETLQNRIKQFEEEQNVAGKLIFDLKEQLARIKLKSKKRIVWGLQAGYGINGFYAGVGITFKIGVL